MTFDEDAKPSNYVARGFYFAIGTWIFWSLANALTEDD